jgi:hypothetical protein
MRNFVQWAKQRFVIYNLLPEYFATIRYSWVDVAWGAGVPAIAFIIPWSLNYPIPTWAIVSFFVWALFVAGYHAWRTDHVRLKPKIRAHGTRQVSRALVNSAGMITGYRIFCQVVMACLTDAPVYECTGHLQRIERWTNENHWEDSGLDQSLTVQWGNETSERRIEQHPGAERPLNVFFYASSEESVGNWRTQRWG